MPGPGLAITNHGANGATILRPGKVWKRKGDLGGLDNYGKLFYHSQYPWEATCLESTEGPLSSAQYVYSHPKDGILTPNVILSAGQREGVLYRRAFFGCTMEEERHWMPKINLADFPVSLGIFRVDQLCLCKYPSTLTLGSFGFPEVGKIEREEMEDPQGLGKAMVIVGEEKGVKRHMALSIFAGWDKMGLRKQLGMNPASESSLVLYARTKRERLYDGTAPSVLISQMITKEGGEGFTLEELFPLSQIRYGDLLGTGDYGPVELFFKDGRVRTVYFSGMEGRLSL